MPVADRLFTDFPAQQHRLAAPVGGEVHETDLDVLDLNAQSIELGDDLGHFVRVLRYLLLGLAQGKDLGRSASVAGNLRSERSRIRLAGTERAGEDDESLGERTHGGERLVRLLDAE